MTGHPPVSAHPRPFLAVILAIGALLALPHAGHAQSCVGDVDGDGSVHGGDLGTLLSWWGPVVPSNPVSQACDLDADGSVGGTDLGRLLGNWGHCPAHIADVTPAQGSVLGGTEITVNGAWLGQASAVTVGGVECAGLKALSPGALTAITPAGAAGSAEVRVTTPAGNFAAPTAFTYLPQGVSSIVPLSCRPQGGQVVTVSGQGLSGTSSVTFGGVAGTSLVIVSDSQLKVTAPAGTPESVVDIAIVGSGGTVTVPRAFAYRAVGVPSWATLLEAAPDPAVVTDPALRAAIVATNWAWRVRDTATQIEMLLVPPGTFDMGCVMGSDAYPCESFELSVHSVTLTRAFYLGRFEVTQSQWLARMGSNPSAFQGYPTRPVESVSWNSVQQFNAATGMRLPTEAEWEFACRAGTRTPYSNGSTSDASLGDIAWYRTNAGNATHETGTKAANALGFHDMLGNVCEWGYDASVPSYSPAAVTDPVVPPDGSFQIVRGGGFPYPPNYARSSSRLIYITPTTASSSIGFRVARNP